MDNPGQWYRYCYRPKFNKKRCRNYVHHALPTGAITVPSNEEGKRKCGAWGFHYAGWENTEEQHRQGSTTNNLLTEEMWGQLDEDVLTTLGLTDHWMKTCDALFFFQVLWKMCHPPKSDIVNDPRVPHFTSVELFTNIYKMSTGNSDNGLSSMFVIVLFNSLKI